MMAMALDEIERVPSACRGALERRPADRYRRRLLDDRRRQRSRLQLPTRLVALTLPAAARRGASRRPTPVIARIEDGRIVIDLRTVAPEDDERLPGSGRRRRGDALSVRSSTSSTLTTYTVKESFPPKGVGPPRERTQNFLLSPRAAQPPAPRRNKKV